MAAETVEEGVMASDHASVPGLDRAVVFTLEEQRYALPIGRVQEIQQIVEPTRVPDSSPALLGMIDLRGRVIPLFDLRTLLGLPPRAFDLETPMIICWLGEATVSLVVDEVEDVVDVPVESVQSPANVSDLADRMLGVFRLEANLVFVLDVEAIVPSVTAAGPAGGGE